MPPGAWPPPADLAPRTARCYARALACGALHPIYTECTTVQDGGVPFCVRVLTDRARRAEAEYRRRKTIRTAGSNPFLPYDEDLFIAELSASHVCLLNKFSVIDDHLLIVTRQFEPQDVALTLADLEAAWICLDKVGGLAFYNAGEVAGASQGHRHLQLVFGPVTENPGIPIEGLLPETSGHQVAAAPAVPFPHAFSRLDPTLTHAPMDAAAACLSVYRNMLEFLDLQRPGQNPSPYNLLFTRRWVLLVPRSRECFSTISVNALGFAGSLLVRDQEELQALKDAGPMAALQQVAGSAPASAGDAPVNSG